MRNFFRLQSFIYLTLFCLALPLTGFAHGLGQNIEQIVGGYYIDIDYDVPEGPVPEDSPVLFGMRILTADRQDLVEVTEIAFTAHDAQGKAVFSLPVKTPSLYAETIATVSFPYTGTYTVAVTFMNEEEELATAEFPLEVSGGKTSLPLQWLFGGLVIGILGGIALPRVMKKS